MSLEAVQRFGMSDFKPDKLQDNYESSDVGAQGTDPVR